MWPRGRSGLGPGSSPVKRAAARASTIWALPVPSVARTCSKERTSVSSRAAALERSRARSQAPRSPPGGPPPASAADRRQGPKRARARIRGTSTRPVPRCRDRRYRTPQRTSRCRLPSSETLLREVISAERQHVRQRRAGIANCVDVEEGRAGDVGLQELGGRVARHGRQVPGAVQHPHVAARAPFLGKPSRAHHQRRFSPAHP